MCVCVASVAVREVVAPGPAFRTCCPFKGVSAWPSKRQHYNKTGQDRTGVGGWLFRGDRVAHAHSTRLYQG